MAFRPKHYDLEVWKEAMRMVRIVYSVTREFPADERFGLSAQMRRAAISVPSNIAEGAACGSRAGLVRYLQIARGSLIELDTQVWLARDLEFISKQDELAQRFVSLFAKLNALIASNRKAGKERK
ncbi:MAG TPA: four helix bundle protein [Rhodanobacteraceae bacterium]|nr:four helix bundle protein [Rhodanobacteraceae bacterium]